MDDCFMCLKRVRRDTEWHLRCSSCKRKLHYVCGLGYAEPVKALRVSTSKEQYVCPVCLVGRQYNYLHMALDRHADFSREARAAHADSDEDDDNSSVVSNVDADVAVDPGTRQIDPGTQPTQQINSGTGNPTPVTAPAAGNTTPDAAHATGDLTPEAVPVTGDIPANNAPEPAADRAANTNTQLTHPLLRLRDGPNADVGSESEDMVPVTHPNESRRIKRFKGALFGLRHLPPTVETLLVLDSNGRDIKGEDIDGSGAKVSVKSIPGLCVSATTAALRESKLVFPKIKHVAFGLGTNDHLHRRLHPGDKGPYIKELDAAARKAFPSAKIHFILPFIAIKGLDVSYVHSIAADIKASKVNWKVHFPPNMKGKLAPPQFIHIKPEERVVFASWLKKIFKPKEAETTLPIPSDTQPVIPTPVVSSSMNFRVLNSDQANNSTPGMRCSNSAVLPPSGELDTNKHSLDSLLKDRLFELVLGQTTARPRMRPPPWQYIEY